MSWGTDAAGPCTGTARPRVLLCVPAGAACITWDMHPAVDNRYRACLVLAGGLHEDDQPRCDRGGGTAHRPASEPLLGWLACMHLARAALGSSQELQYL